MRSPRERRLFYATLTSGLAVVMVHLGSPAGCSTAVKAIDRRPVYQPLAAGEQRELVLVRPSLAPTSTAAAAARALVTATPPVDATRAIIGRGEVIGIDRKGAGHVPVEGAFAGYDAPRERILVAVEDRLVYGVPLAEVKQLSVLGESATPAYAGNGALIGGLAGLVLGATPFLAMAAEHPDNQYLPLCAAMSGGGGALVGAGLGAVIGAAVSPDRARTTYPIGPTDWVVAPAAPGGAR